ncbi:MAG: AarF/UbiB family protein [Collinsella sp.]
MDYVDGISIADPERLVEAGYDLEKVGSSIVDDYATQVLQDGFFHADPHAGNIIVRDGIVYFIDMGMVGRMSSHDRGIVKDMIYAVATGDVPKLKDSLMRFAVTRGDSAELDHSTFLSDLDFIIADFAGLDLKRPRHRRVPDLPHQPGAQERCRIAQRGDDVRPRHGDARGPAHRVYARRQHD